MSSVPPSLMNQRYHVEALLGEGGMGQVFRAYDRLTGQIVALKRVLIAPRDLPFASRPLDENTETLLLALAHEFRILASLRHPHIISVLDYGFDTERQPFFTMELLAAAHTLLHAGRAAPQPVQLALLAQLLEALVYLHRRGILHHDLKPDNVLVQAGQVRLLDFGLAILPEQARDNDSFGTLRYLAPEVLDGQPYTVAADLYAVGVLAYELLVGAHPFEAPSVGAFLDRVGMANPDLTPLADQPVLQAVVAQLLAARPHERFASAAAALTALRVAAGAPVTADATAIRESFLQAATFVGRTAERAQLRGALAHTMTGRGGIWLVGGESGVGKSRLVEELRAEALVVGALVLRGQAVEGGWQSYQLWRDPLRALVVAVELTDREASVLLDVVPDLDWLRGRVVAPAPALDARGTRQRLAATIVAVVRRAAQPLVLVLEDLQWASESLELLRDMVRQLADQPVLVVGTYRDDERPLLPEYLPSVHVLKLARLDASELAALSAAMLGAAGTRPDVVALLARETEGNAFFTVEVVRALAEEAGGLTQIGHITLPINVAAGGVEQLIQRRLARVPHAAQPLLTVAAVAGRQLDARVLQALVDAHPDLWASSDLAAWLRAGVDAGVLELADERWRFAHDKLRSGVLTNLSAAELPRAHRTVAEAIEAAYPDPHGRATVIEALLAHWQAAGDVARELAYLSPVVRRMIEVAGAYGPARTLAERGLTLLDTTVIVDAAPIRIQLLGLLGAAARSLGDLSYAETQLQAGILLTDTHHDLALRVPLLLQLAELRWHTAELAAMGATAADAFVLAKACADRRSMADALKLLGLHASLVGDYVAAMRDGHASLAFYAALHDPAGQAQVYHNLGNAMIDHGQLVEGEHYYTQSLQLGQGVVSPYQTSMTQLNLGTVAYYRGDVHGARTWYAQSLAIAEAIDTTHVIAFASSKLGELSYAIGDYAVAQEQLQYASALMKAHAIGDGLSFNVVTFGLVCWQRGDLAAWQQCEEGLALALAQGNRWDEIYARIALGRLALDAGDLDAARKQLDVSVTLSHTVPELAANSLRARGQLLLAGDTHAAAITDLSASVALARQLEFTPSLAESLALLAVGQAHIGDPAAATNLREAALLARKLAALTPLKLHVVLAAAQCAQQTGRQTMLDMLVEAVVAHPYTPVPLRSAATQLSVATTPATLPHQLPDLDALLDVISVW